MKKAEGGRQGKGEYARGIKVEGGELGVSGIGRSELKVLTVRLHRYH